MYNMLLPLHVQNGQFFLSALLLHQYIFKPKEYKISLIDENVHYIYFYIWYIIPHINHMIYDNLNFFDQYLITYFKLIKHFALFMILGESKFNNKIIRSIDIELSYYYYDFKLFYYKNNISYFYLFTVYWDITLLFIIIN